MNTPELPSSPEAERAVLGAILLSNGELFPDVAATLDPGDFFLESHRRIFRQMGEIKGPIDLVTLTEALAKAGELDTVGGASYIASLTDGFPKLSNVDSYNEILKAKAGLRNLAHIGNSTVSRALEGDANPQELAAQAQRELLDLAAGSGPGPQTISQLYRTTFTSVDELDQAWRAQRGTPTGFTALDETTGGLHAGEMALLAARPSVGKTAFALNIALNIAESTEQTIAVFSLEMTARSILQRLICSCASVDSRRMEAGFCDLIEKSNLARAATRLCSLPMYVDDQADIRPETILARARTLKRRTGSLGLIVVDYLQLVNGGSRFTRGGESARYQEISYISRAMKQMAKDLETPVLALSQLNRAPEDRTGPPRLSDLRESGQLEQDADAVLFLWQDQPSSAAKRHADKAPSPEPEIQSNSKAINCTVAKQRNGPTKTFKLDFYRTFTRFENHNQVSNP